MTTILKITGLNPLLFRDGRPFGAEEGSLAARSLSHPHPSTLAGFVRTSYGNQEGWDWKNDKSCAEQAKQIAVHSPLFLRNDKVVFPAPADAVLYKDDANIENRMSLRPCHSLAGGSDLPEGLLPLSVMAECKPLPNVKFWSEESMKEWLGNAAGSIEMPEYYGGLPTEDRVHVAIAPETGKGIDGMLYSVNRLGFEDYSAELYPDRHKAKPGERQKEKECWSFLIRTETPKPIQTGIGTLGGERGLATVELAEEGKWPGCSESLLTALKGATRIRMVLATPAIFSEGWAPGWLAKENGALIGTPPGAEEVRLKLISAAAGRREPVSGWDFENKCPKPVRWMVPAGAVYFFEVIGEAKLPTESLWLQPMSDDEQDRRDGFGLALWGVWDYSNECDK